LAGCLLATLLAAGCGHGNAEGTGAEEVTRTYFEALCRRDWPAAFAALHPDSRRAGEKAFSRLAASYRRGLGFEPGEVRIRSCEEHGDEAVAHVVITGQVSNRHRSFKDAVVLRHGPGGWGVVLTPRFGRADKFP
jgi:hypothetical protein